MTLLLIPEIFSQALVREDFSMMNAMVGAATLLSLVFLTTLVSYRFKRAGEVVEGQPTVLVSDGRLVGGNLDTERVSPDEIYAEMHKAGLDRIEQVRWAILETDGRISLVPKRGPASPAKVLSEENAI